MFTNTSRHQGEDIEQLSIQAASSPVTIRRSPRLHVYHFTQCTTVLPCDLRSPARYKLQGGGAREGIKKRDNRRLKDINLAL